MTMVVEAPLESLPEVVTEHWHDGPPKMGCRAACGLVFGPAADQDADVGVPCSGCLAILHGRTPPRCPGCRRNSR